MKAQAYLFIHSDFTVTFNLTVLLEDRMSDGLHSQGIKNSWMKIGSSVVPFKSEDKGTYWWEIHSYTVPPLCKSAECRNEKSNYETSVLLISHENAFFLRGHHFHNKLLKNNIRNYNSTFTNKTLLMASGGISGRLCSTFQSCQSYFCEMQPYFTNIED